MGQGDATLFEFENGAILVDTGGEQNDQFSSDDALVDYLEDFFAARPDESSEGPKRTAMAPKPAIAIWAWHKKATCVHTQS